MTPAQKGRELQLGRPREFLKDAGFGDAEIVLDYDKLVKKSSESYKNEHPFDIADIKNLPNAINSPIAVFDNTNGQNRGKVILTELQRDGNNFIVAVRATERHKKGGVVLEVNEIKSLFPKEARGIVNWLNTDKACNINKEKALDWLGALRNHRGTELTEQELSDAAKVVNSSDISKQKGINYRIGEAYDYERYPLGRVEPGLAEKEVEVVEAAADHGFGNYKEAKKWAKENISKVYDDEETGGKGLVRISNGAIDKFLSQSAVEKSETKDVHMAVLKVLPEVLRESIEVETHPDFLKGEDGKRNIENGINKDVLVHRCYGAANINGKIFRVKTTMQEFRGANPNRPHSFEVTKVELIDSPTTEVLPNSSPLDASNSSKNELPNSPGTAVKPDSSPLGKTSDNSISVAKLLNGVEKSYDADKKLLDKSKDLTDDETSFRNLNDAVRTADDAPAVVKHIDKIAKQVGGKVKMVSSVDEITDRAAKRAIEEGRNVTGWYDEKTGEVHLYMPNIHDRYTAEKTIWHEVVGHKGMRELIGEENYSKFLRNLWYDLDRPENARLKELVNEELRYNPLDFEICSRRATWTR